MESKFGVVCNAEKSIDNFYKKYKESKKVNNKGSLNCYYEDRDKISNQQNLYYEKRWR